MCNSYEQRVAWQAYKDMLKHLRIEAPAWQAEHDLPRSDMVRIGDTAPVMRQAGAAVELAPMKFGFPPPRPNSGPVFNFRSEGRRFGAALRCLIPASAFFEYTGTKYPKTRWRFSLAGEDMMAIAGIWRPGEGNQPPSFAMLTTDPGPDVKPYHNRQIVVLRPDDWRAWLDLSKPENELLRPLQEESLIVSETKTKIEHVHR